MGENVISVKKTANFKGYVFFLCFISLLICSTCAKKEYGALSPQTIRKLRQDISNEHISPNEHIKTQNKEDVHTSKYPYNSAYVSHMLHTRRLLTEMGYTEEEDEEECRNAHTQIDGASIEHESSTPLYYDLKGNISFDVGPCYVNSIYGMAGSGGCQDPIHDHTTYVEFARSLYYIDAHMYPFDDQAFRQKTHQQDTTTNEDTDTSCVLQDILRDPNFDNNLADMYLVHPSGSVYTGTVYHVKDNPDLRSPEKFVSEHIRAQVQGFQIDIINQQDITPELGGMSAFLEYDPTTEWQIALLGTMNGLRLVGRLSALEWDTNLEEYAKQSLTMMDNENLCQMTHTTLKSRSSVGKFRFLGEILQERWTTDAYPNVEEIVFEWIKDSRCYKYGKVGEACDLIQNSLCSDTPTNANFIQIMLEHITHVGCDFRRCSAGPHGRHARRAQMRKQAESTELKTHLLTDSHGYNDMQVTEDLKLPFPLKNLVQCVFASEHSIGGAILGAYPFSQKTADGLGFESCG